MNELVFIRHAKTDLSGRFCGHCDPPVDEEGLRQIDAMLAGLPFETFHSIVASDLQRARTTAEAIAARGGMTVTTLPELREIYFGTWEGLTWQEIEALDPAYAARWLAEFPGLPAPLGESFADFRGRVLDVVGRLARAGTGRCAVVTHGGVMRVVLEELRGVSQDEAWERTRDFCCSFVYVPEPAAVLR